MSSGGVNLVMEHLKGNQSPENSETTQTEPTANMDGAGETIDLGDPVGNIQATTTNGSSNQTHSRHYDENEGFGQQIYRRIMEAKTDSSDNVQFAYAVITIILGSIVGLGFLLLTTALPIAMIAIGVSHLDNCPAIPELPILLIVAGSILAAGSLINIGDQFLEGYVYHTGGKRKSNLITLLNVLLCGLMLAALILGCIWVYGNPKPADTPSPTAYFPSTARPASTLFPTMLPPMTHAPLPTPSGGSSIGHNYFRNNYCHPTLWQFSYWLLNVSWILIGLVVLLSIIGIVSANLMH
ncbi:hypothetical protein HDE_10703 [Halotydeus destructor]|nr:hypothetical protein HDE_10703 [Halotydeus destructor]